LSFLQRLLAVVGTVGVDHQLGIRADGPARGDDASKVLLRLASDLHLDAGDALRDPAGELLPEALDGVGSEASATVDGHALVEAPEQVGERDLKQPRLQVPERCIHGRDGHRTDSRPPGVAEGVLHRGPGRLNAHRVLAIHGTCQLGLDQLSR
jgi:hypothetical protein